jgi:hypothetical protein
MLKAPRGVWGLAADRFGLQIFPLQRRVAPKTSQDIKQDIRQEPSERTS